jgi:hypothetical protein
VLLVSFLGLALPGSALGFGALSSFGEYGGGAGQLRAPKQAALDPAGNLYVADSGNNRIAVFAGDGVFRQPIGEGDLLKPEDVALDPAGNVYVADTGNNRVDIFDPAGELLSAFGEGQLDHPSGIAVTASVLSPTIYVADTGNDRIAAFTPAGNPLSPIEPIPSPRDVIVGDDGNFYVADTGNERIDVFSKGGGPVGSFGETGPGALSGPVALASDGAGGIYVADQVAERVEQFSEAGGFLGGFAAEPGVAGVAAGCGGNVFAVEEAPLFARVERFGEPRTPSPPCAELPQPELIVDPAAKLASNRFHFAGLVKNRGNGFAVLYVRVPAPGKLNLNGRGFRRLSRIAPRAMRVRLPIKPKVRLRHFLERHGKGRIRVEVTFTPVGGVPRTLEKVIVLRRHRG